ncbi:hypothetical protein [Henriciella aquimarina]|uniref:hypothetical protein n=1 Tax=Henriciella aquimarina TaxID=545261 RepID=UPI0009FD407E|nr:hypothetical protein [Henriciella aquimarina]
MSEWFEEVEPGIYQCAGLKLETAAQAEAWTDAFGALLARATPFSLIIDTAQQPHPEAGKVFILWLKANRARLAEKVRRVIYVIEDPQERAVSQERSDKAGAAMPYPVEIVATFDDALQAARRALVTQE